MRSKLFLGAAASLAAMAGLASPGLHVLSAPAPEPMPKKRRTRAKKRAKATPSYLTTRGKYIPGGEYRNCGDKGISPKSVRRHANG